MASKDLAKLIPKYEQLFRECPEAALADHPTTKITIDPDPPSDLLKTLVGTFSTPSDPRDASIATSVWGDKYQQKEEQSEAGDAPSASSQPPCWSSKVGKAPLPEQEILDQLENLTDEAKSTLEYTFVAREGGGLQTLNHKELDYKRSFEREEFNPRRLKLVRRKLGTGEYEVVWNGKSEAQQVQIDTSTGSSKFLCDVSSYHPRVFMRTAAMISDPT
jgi:hypothetical protein